MANNVGPAESPGSQAYSPSEESGTSATITTTNSAETLATSFLGPDSTVHVGVAGNGLGNYFWTHLANLAVVQNVQSALSHMQAQLNNGSGNGNSSAVQPGQALNQVGNATSLAVSDPYSCLNGPVETIQMPDFPYANALRPMATTVQAAFNRIDSIRRAFYTHGRKVLFQGGSTDVNVDDHTSGVMGASAVLEVLQIIDHIAESFGDVAFRRMMTGPQRPGRQVVMVEVTYEDAKSGRDAIDSMRGLNQLGMLSSTIPLRDGASPSAVYRIWTAKFDELVFLNLPWTASLSSEALDAAGDHVGAMQMRWMGSPVYAPYSDLPMLPSRPDNASEETKASLNYPEFTGHQLARRRNTGFARDAHSLNLYDILAGRDVRTTVMWKNIPMFATAMHINAFLAWAVKGLYDYSYLRCDFQTSDSVGYAFINMTDALHIIPLAYAIQHKRWAMPPLKRAELSYAKDQSRDSMIARFRNSAVMLQPWGQRPHLWYPIEDHRFPNEEEFPAPDNATRLRTSQNNVGNGLFVPNRRGHPRRSAGGHGNFPPTRS